MDGITKAYMALARRGQAIRDTQQQPEKPKPQPEPKPDQSRQQQ